MVAKINKTIKVGRQSTPHPAYYAGSPWAFMPYPHTRSYGENRGQSAYAVIAQGAFQGQEQCKEQGDALNTISNLSKESHAGQVNGLRYAEQRGQQEQYRPAPWHESTAILNSLSPCAGRLGSKKRYGHRDQNGNFISKHLQGRYMTIETSEHQHLLQLYYAVYTDSVRPNAETERKYMEALEKCNIFYEGKTACHL